MKIDKGCKIEKCCGKNRGAIDNPYLTVSPTENKISATNGRILVEMPVRIDDGDVSGEITQSALKAARELSGRSSDIQIKANGSLAIPAGATFPRNADIHFPNVNAIYPTENEIVKICLDVRLLNKIADAFNEDHIILEIVGSEKAVRVFARNNKQKKGLIMPVLI